MESRKRSSYNEDSSVDKELDKIANNMKNLPDRRKKLLKDLMGKRLYDSKEACEILGVSLPSLRRAIHLGRIKTVYIGRFLRIPADELEQLVQGQEALSVKETAELLNVGVITIRNMIKDGRIKAFRLTESGPFHIPVKEVEKFIGGDVRQAYILKDYDYTCH